MKRQRKMLAGLILLGMTVFLDSSLSQTRRSSMSRRQQRVYRPVRMTEAQRKERIESAMAQASDQALKEALAATPAQWPMIEPKLRKVNELQDQAEVAVKIKNVKLVTTTETLRGDRAVAAGGKANEPLTTTTTERQDWSYIKPWERNSSQSGVVSWGYTAPWERKNSLSGAERACEDLVSLIESGNATDEQKKAKMETLREAKKKAAEELALAQDELKEVLSLRQQAKLVLLGLLE